MEKNATANKPRIELVRSRTVPFLDAETLAFRTAREALFRTDDTFILYLSDGRPTPAVEERVIKLSAREALIWLNEGVEEAGSFWD